MAPCRAMKLLFLRNNMETFWVWLVCLCVHGFMPHRPLTRMAAHVVDKVGVIASRDALNAAMACCWLLVGVLSVGRYFQDSDDEQPKIIVTAATSFSLTFLIL